MYTEIGIAFVKILIRDQILAFLVAARFSHTHSGAVQKLDIDKTQKKPEMENDFVRVSSKERTGRMDDGKHSATYHQAFRAMIELVTVARVPTRRIGAFHSAGVFIVGATQDNDLLDFVLATVVAYRIGRVAAKEGADLPDQFLADLIELLTVEIVVISRDRRVSAFNVDHFIGITNDSNTRDTILALEHERVFPPFFFFFFFENIIIVVLLLIIVVVVVTSGKSTHSWAYSPNRFSRY